jgi:hypothetical protein
MIAPCLINKRKIPIGRLYLQGVHKFFVHVLTLITLDPSQNQKTHVPGFSPKYFTIWGRNMDTKHTTD